MTKIVYNNCPGGSDLSYLGVMRYAEIKGMKLFAFTDKRDEHGIIQLREAKIRVTSPEEASSVFSIYYYTSEDASDGREFVRTNYDYEWNIAP